MAEKKVVMLFGSFDSLHEGHRDFFRQARQHGDEVVAVVARDDTIEHIKGRAPRYTAEERRKAVLATGLVDRAVIGNPRNKYDIIESVQPDVICLGYDQTTFTDKLAEHLEAMGIDAKVVRLKAYRPHLYKSSKLRGWKADVERMES